MRNKKETASTAKTRGEERRKKQKEEAKIKATVEM